MNDILRLSVADEAVLLRHFAEGPAQPLLLTDATAGWPARQRWTFEFFVREYGDRMGLVTGTFGGADGLATTLGQYIAGLDGPLAETRGFWVDAQHNPTASPPPEAVDAAWGFTWPAFKVAPELLDDISPYPLALPNCVAGLDDDVLRLLQDLSGFQFNSLYIDRAGTITPLHSDHSHSIGSLAQFAGEKLVVLYDVAEAGDDGHDGFNPEQPDFAAFPQMRGLTGHSCVLKPGELLIIPPSWPHYVRALSHSITLSHNFFNQFNLSAYLREQLQAMVRRGRGDHMCRAIVKRLGVPDFDAGGA